MQQEFRAAQYRGLPLPILWIVDYFVIDGEGQRYGRFYRTAGWYTHILMWTAFPCWLLAVILFKSGKFHNHYYRKSQTVFLYIKIVFSSIFSYIVRRILSWNMWRTSVTWKSHLFCNSKSHTIVDTF